MHLHWKITVQLLDFFKQIKICVGVLNLLENLLMQMMPWSQIKF